MDSRRRRYFKEFTQIDDDLASVRKKSLRQYSSGINNQPGKDKIKNLTNLTKEDNTKNGSKLRRADADNEFMGSPSNSQAKNYLRPLETETSLSRSEPPNTVEHKSMEISSLENEKQTRLQLAAINNVTLSQLESPTDHYSSIQTNFDEISSNSNYMDVNELIPLKPQNNIKNTSIWPESVSGTKSANPELLWEKPYVELTSVSPVILAEETASIVLDFCDESNAVSPKVIEETTLLSSIHDKSNSIDNSAIEATASTLSGFCDESNAVNPVAIGATAPTLPNSNESLTPVYNEDVEANSSLTSVSNSFPGVIAVCPEFIEETAPTLSEISYNVTTAAIQNTSISFEEDVSSIITLSPLNEKYVHPTNIDANINDSYSTEQTIIITTNADIHKEPSTSPRPQLTSREKQIQLCLQEIREEPMDNIDVCHETIPQYEDDEIVVVIEALDDNCYQNESNNNATSTNRSRKFQYIDFLSENEYFEWSSSSWEPDSEYDAHQKKKKRMKKSNKQSDEKKLSEIHLNRQNSNTAAKPDNYINDELQLIETEAELNAKESDKENFRKKKTTINKAKERSKLKHLGQEYITKTGKTIQAKKIKENPCQPGKCRNNCFEIEEERRSAIFKYYWNLSSERRRDWIINHSIKDKTKRKRSHINSRREWSTQYFINDGEGQRKVCQQFLLNTLDICQRFVHYVISNSSSGMTKEDGRGKHEPVNKTSELLMQTVRSYIENLPSVPSHYCRKESNKMYLPQEFKNTSNLYRLYKQTKQSEGADFVGERVFKNVFKKEYNLSFHVPRKDKCMKCIKFENGVTDQYEEEKALHLQDKKETYERFRVHQNAHNQDSSILCTTFDLQKVLNTPHGQSMLLYYSMKLAVYNLTFYESQTRNGFCFTWNETQGKRGANEICTILSQYIEKVDTRGNIKHLLLYCDSCPGQNKNRIVLACISHCLNKCVSITGIQINYLLPGHTFMPVDSMHSVIEKSVKNSIIWAPSQWETVFTLARKAPKPYEVKTLTFKDFESWDSISERYFRGNLEGKISKLRIVTFNKSTPDKITIKYSMAADAEGHDIEILAKNDKTPKQVYKTPLNISKKKYSHLMKLCTNETIPKQYQVEYKNLPKAANVKDTLPDSDIEDE